MDCSSITDFQQSTAIRIAKKFRNLHIGKGGCNKSDDFLEKYQRGGGGHFQSKNLFSRFWEL